MRRMDIGRVNFLDELFDVYSFPPNMVFIVGGEGTLALHGIKRNQKYLSIVVPYEIFEFLKSHPWVEIYKDRINLLTYLVNGNIRIYHHHPRIGMMYEQIVEFYNLLNVEDILFFTLKMAIDAKSSKHEKYAMKKIITYLDEKEIYIN